MIDNLITKVKGFFLSPAETFRQSRNDEFPSVFVYFGILLLINAVLSALIAALGMAVMPETFGMSFGLAVPVMVFLIMFVGGCIATLIFAVWLHLWVYILGGRKGIMQTINAVIYGSTPRLLLGWMPFVGILFTLWSLILGVLGVSELQELGTGKAALAVIIAVIIPLIVIILIAAWFMTSVMTVTALPVAPNNIG